MQIINQREEKTKENMIVYSYLFVEIKSTPPL